MLQLLSKLWSKKQTKQPVPQQSKRRRERYVRPELEVLESRVLLNNNTFIWSPQNSNQSSLNVDNWLCLVNGQYVRGVTDPNTNDTVIFDGMVANLPIDWTGSVGLTQMQLTNSYTANQTIEAGISVQTRSVNQTAGDLNVRFNGTSTSDASFRIVGDGTNSSTLKNFTFYNNPSYTGEVDIVGSTVSVATSSAYTEGINVPLYVGISAILAVGPTGATSGTLYVYGGGEIDVQNEGTVTFKDNGLTGVSYAVPVPVKGTTQPVLNIWNGGTLTATVTSGSTDYLGLPVQNYGLSTFAGGGTGTSTFVIDGSVNVANGTMGSTNVSMFNDGKNSTTAEVDLLTGITLDTYYGFYMGTFNSGTAVMKTDSFADILETDPNAGTVPNIYFDTGSSLLINLNSSSYQVFTVVTNLFTFLGSLTIKASATGNDELSVIGNITYDGNTGTSITINNQGGNWQNGQRFQAINLVGNNLGGHYDMIPVNTPFALDPTFGYIDYTG